MNEVGKLYYIRMTHVGSIPGQNYLDTPKCIPFFFFLSGLKQLFYLAASSVGQEFGQDLPRYLPDAWGLKGSISKMASSRRCQHAFLFHFGLHFGRTYKHFQNLDIVGIFLVVQWLRLHTPNPGVQGSIPSQGTRSHTWQLKDHACHT